jgi:hypothetical protein
MKDYKLKRRNLRVSHTLSWSKKNHHLRIFCLLLTARLFCSFSFFALFFEKHQEKGNRMAERRSRACAYAGGGAAVLALLAVVLMKGNPRRAVLADRRQYSNMCAVACAGQGGGVWGEGGSAKTCAVCRLANKQTQLYAQEEGTLLHVNSHGLQTTSLRGISGIKYQKSARAPAHKNCQRRKS